MLNRCCGHGDNREKSASAQISQADEDLATKPKSLLHDSAETKFLLGGKAKHLAAKAC